MSKERIFELIRKEEMVLFVGAGMSLYAGYPSGAKLAEILYNGITEDFKDELEFTCDLPKLAEEIYNLKGGNKNYLIEILKREIQKLPTSTNTHDLLAKIPQFKTIITTNYDSLFESTNNNIEVIRKAKDYPVADTKKQLLFKIHGDLIDTERIILATSDYNNYFSRNQEDTVFWNAVKDKLASNHILFIGYAMEDTNISVILDRIMNELGDTRKEIFFVSPSIKQSKLKYLERKGIQYIKSTGEELVDEILRDLKLNYFPGLNKGEGTADTAMNFANSNQITLDLSKENNKILIKNAKSSDQKNDHKVNFKINFPNEKKDQIMNSLHGKDFNDISLEGESLEEFNYFIKDFRIRNEKDLKSLQIKKVPFFNGLIDILFDDGFEVDNYNVELYSAHLDNKEKHVKIEVEGFTVNLKLKHKNPGNNLQFDIEIIPDAVIKSTKDGFRFYEILSEVITNQKFKIFKNNQLKYTQPFNFSFTEDAFGAKYLKEYFSKLKKIERHFDVRFTKINLKEPKFNLVEAIIAYIDKRQLEKQFDIGLKFKNGNKKDIDYLAKNDGKGKLLIISDKYPPIDLHDLQFDIGYLHQIVKDCYIANLEELKANKATEIEVKSKTNTIYHQFTDEENIIIEQ